MNQRPTPILLAALAATLLLALPATGAEFHHRFQPGPENLRLADPKVLAWLRATDVGGLPAAMTPREAARWQPKPPLRVLPGSLPDYQRLRPQAEYERNEAILMRWGQNNAELTSMIVPITTGDSLARVMLLVANGSQQSSATSALAGAGANLGRVEFMIAASDSVWIRDYGPRFASGDYGRIIIDHDYDRPRPLDNQVPAAMAAHLNVPIYELPLAQGGGNYHSFGHGEAFITRKILEFNSGVTEQQVINFFAAYQGVDLTFFDMLPPSYDGTGHLDMWFLPVDDETVIIGEYDPKEAGGVPYDVTEDAVSIMQARGYTVLRTPGWQGPNPTFGGNAHFTYTNGVIVNNIVIMCEFDGYDDENTAAEAAYAQAFPDRTIVAVDCTDIIGLSGALHCIVKHMPYSEAYLDRPPYY